MGSRGESRSLPPVVSRRESLVQVPRAAHAHGCDPTAITFGLDGVSGQGQERPSFERDETADVSPWIGAGGEGNLQARRVGSGGGDKPPDRWVQGERKSPARDQTAKRLTGANEARCRGAPCRRGCNGERAAGSPCQARGTTTHSLHRTLAP